MSADVAVSADVAGAADVAVGLGAEPRDVAEAADAAASSRALRPVLVLGPGRCPALPDFGPGT